MSHFEFGRLIKSGPSGRRDSFYGILPCHIEITAVLGLQQIASHNTTHGEFDLNAVVAKKTLHLPAGTQP